MRYLVDLSPDQLQRIKALIDTGRYESAIQFVETAIENQLSLEEKPFGVLEGDDSSSPVREGRSLSPEILPVRGDRLLLRPPKDIPLTRESPNPTQDKVWGMYNRILP